jgi:hypothetical protein
MFIRGMLGHDTVVLFKIHSKSAMILLILLYFLFDTASAADTSSRNDLRNKRMSIAKYNNVGVRFIHLRQPPDIDRRSEQCSLQGIQAYCSELIIYIQNCNVTLL